MYCVLSSQTATANTLMTSTWDQIYIYIYISHYGQTTGGCVCSRAEEQEVWTIYWRNFWTWCYSICWFPMFEPRTEALWGRYVWWTIQRDSFGRFNYLLFIAYVFLCAVTNIILLLIIGIHFGKHYLLNVFKSLSLVYNSVYAIIAAYGDAFLVK